jgi:hypothetical protein
MHADRRQRFFSGAFKSVTLDGKGAEYGESAGFRLRTF